MKLQEYKGKPLRKLFYVHSMSCICVGKTDITFSVDDSGINLTIRDQPIPEDESEAKQALNQVANTLRLVCAHWCAQLIFPRN